MRPPTDPRLMHSRDFRTLNELFLKAVERHSKPDAYLSRSGGQYRGLSSREALRKVAALASALERRGVRQGDRVAILSETRVEWALTDYAVLGLDASDVPIYPTLLEPDVEYILRDSGSKGIVVSTENQLKKVLNVRSKLAELKFVLVMDGGAVSEGAAEDWHKVVDDELNRAVDPVTSFRAKAQEVKPQDTASIIYTSGTTGQAKGVVLTHANIVSNIHSTLGMFPLGPEDVGMSFLPLCHVFERMLDYVYFWLGVSIAYAESFEALPQNLREVRPTVVAVVPRVLEKIYEKVVETVRQSSPAKARLFRGAVKVGRRYFPYGLEGRRPPFGLRLKHAVADALVSSKIRARVGGRVGAMISGAAPLSRDLAEFFYAMGLPVYEGYGLTETSPVISVNYPGCTKLGTVGRIVPGVEVKLSDEIFDQEGGGGREILVRGPNVTPGYYHLEEENRRAFAEGWFRTGDLGTIDADGYLTITGRKKDLFKTSGGKYVSPEKLENLFQGNPYITQIMVLGDGRRSVSALMVPNFARLETYARSRGVTFKNREELVASPQIHSFFEEQVDEVTRLLPPHEKIRHIALMPKEFTIDSGELTATQKIKRRVVEEHYRDLIETMYLKPADQSHPAVSR